ncbi:MAG: hypothetical protein R2856_29315 [Caldilineaceae bacterium]
MLGAMRLPLRRRIAQDGVVDRRITISLVMAMMIRRAVNVRWRPGAR